MFLEKLRKYLNKRAAKKRNATIIDNTMQILWSTLIVVTSPAWAPIMCLYLVVKWMRMGKWQKRWLNLKLKFV
jgi:predicted PurR-regulated permease PerM